MAPQHTASTTAAGAPQTKFPAEAGHFYNEVSEQQMAAAREESAALLASDEWELVDGQPYPYDQCA